MRAALLTGYGSLVISEVQRPEPGDGQVLVRVRAASLNAVDWYGFSGRPYAARLMMGLRGPKSRDLGSDFAGVVEEVGAGVDDFCARRRGVRLRRRGVRGVRRRRRRSRAEAGGPVVLGCCCGSARGSDGPA